MTPLHKACISGREEEIAQALQFDSDRDLTLTVKDEEGLTPLDRAVCSAHGALAERLWQNSTPGSMARRLPLPVTLANAVKTCEQGHYHLSLYYLRQAGFPELQLKHPTLSVLFHAARHDLPEVIDLIFQLQDGIPIEDKINCSDLKDGLSPLHLACRSGSVRAFEKLLELGCDPLAGGIYQVPPLALAVLQPKILQAAVLKDINPNTILKGRPMLAYTLDPEHIEAMRCLIYRGADIPTGRMLPTTAQLMIPPRLNLSAPLKNTTPLHIACQAGDTALIEHLLQKEASLLAVDATGHTPFGQLLCNHPDNIAELGKLISLPALTTGTRRLEFIRELLRAPVENYNQAWAVLEYFEQEDLPQLEQQCALFLKPAYLAIPAGVAVLQTLQEVKYMLDTNLQAIRQQVHIDHVALKQSPKPIVPTEFLDEVMLSVMKDPVEVLGHRYDRATIERIICEQRVCPFTRRPITLDDIRALSDVRQRIQDYFMQI